VAANWATRRRAVGYQDFHVPAHYADNETRAGVGRELGVEFADTSLHAAKTHSKNRCDFVVAFVAEDAAKDIDFLPAKAIGGGKGFPCPIAKEGTGFDRRFWWIHGKFLSIGV
jgi:hypothetical protein